MIEQIDDVSITSGDTSLECDVWIWISSWASFISYHFTRVALTFYEELSLVLRDHTLWDLTQLYTSVPFPWFHVLCHPVLVLFTVCDDENFTLCHLNSYSSSWCRTVWGDKCLDLVLSILWISQEFYSSCDWLIVNSIVILSAGWCGGEPIYNPIDRSEFARFYVQW